MARRIRIALIVVSLLIASLAACGGGQSGPNMKEGLWEITVKMDMPGMPMQMPPQSYRHCLSQKDMVPKTQEQPGQTGCKEVKREVKGDTVSWVVECRAEEGTVTNSGTLTYRGDTLEGLVKVRVPDGRKGTMEMTQHMNGKWVGPCK